MLKRLRQRTAIGVLPWIIGSAVVIGAIVLVARQQHAAAEKYEAAREKRCASSSLLNPEQQDTCKHERDGPDNYLPWWYVLIAWPAGITVWAVIFTLGVIGWQSSETRKAANSALKSAQAQMDANRAWMLVCSVKPKNLAAPISGSGTLLRHSARVTFKNFGQSPAKIKGYRFELQIGDSMEEPPNFLIVQEFHIVKDAYVIPPGDPFAFDALLNGDQAIISSQDIVALQKMEKYLWLCGYVGYYDAFKRGPFETLVCQLYLVPPRSPSDELVVVAGPPGCNECS